MLEYWKQNPHVTFAFYAVPRELKEMLIKQKKMRTKEAVAFIDRYKHVRFAIYKYAMINLFPDKNFLQIRDTKNSIYMLLNKKQKKPKTTIKRLGKFLLDNYELIFEPDGNA